MNASDLIAELRDLIDRYGDYPVWVNDTDGDRHELLPDWINIEDGDAEGNYFYLG